MTNLDLSQAAWRTSSHSGTTGGNCVEVRVAADAVAVRDSKNPSGPVLAFDAGTWASFLGTLRAGELAQRGPRRRRRAKAVHPMSTST